MPVTHGVRGSSPLRTAPKKTIERLSSFFVYIYLSRALLIKSTSLQIDILSRVQAPANLSICNIALQFGPRELNLSWRRLLKLLGGVSSVVFIRTAHRRLRHSFADDALKRDIRVPYAPHQRRQSKGCLLFLYPYESIVDCQSTMCYVEYHFVCKPTI